MLQGLNIVLGCCSSKLRDTYISVVQWVVQSLCKLFIVKAFLLRQGNQGVNDGNF